MSELDAEREHETQERACIRHFDGGEPWEEALRHAREEAEGGQLKLGTEGGNNG